MSNKKYDRILVVDIEATCWSSKEEQGQQLSEIIEIGICSLNIKNFDITEKKSYIVKPNLSTISSYCTDLTGITCDSVKYGLPITDALNKLKKEYGSSTRTWASWGDGDRKKFYQTCSTVQDANYPFSQSHINVASLFMFAKGIKKNIGLKNALDMLGIKFEGKQHRGCDDAYNTAVILKHLLSRHRD